MIVGSVFHGDNHEELMDVQHECYGRALAMLVYPAVHRYLDSAELLNIKDDLVKELAPYRSSGFDHRVFQRPHDMLAAYFRFSGTDLAQSLFDSDVDLYRDRLEKRWLAFVKEESDALHRSNTFVRAVAVSLAFQGLPEAILAECSLTVCIAHHHEDFFIELASRLHLAEYLMPEIKAE